MRTVTTSMNHYLHQKRSTEPILVIGVDWNGREVFYSDSHLAGAQNRICDSSEIYDMLKVVGSGGAKSITVALEDSGGDLKTIMDNYDFHMRTCNVYLLFDGLSLEDKLLLFSGNIVTPILWNTTSRSLTFSVMTDFDNQDAGFDMGEGAFPELPEDTETEWPMCFGQVCRMSPVLVRSPLQGTLVDEEGIMDPSLPVRLCQAKELQCPVVQVATADSSSGNTIGGAATTAIQGYWWHQEEPVKIPIYAPDASCVQKRYNEICDLLEEIEDQQSKQHSTIEIVDGNKFPRGNITLVIDEAELRGSFSGNTFRITDRKHPEYDELGTQKCVNIPGEGLTYENIPRSHPKIENRTGTAWANYYSQQNAKFDTQAYYKDNVSIRLPGDYECSSSDNEPTLAITGGSSESWDVYNALKSGSIFMMRAGAKVFQKGDETYIYVVSIVPGTVTSVAAYKNQKESDKKYLVEVPSDYYSVVETNYGGYTATEVHMNRKLSNIDETWEDEAIAVSFTSDVGPNPADVIQWLLNKYSTYSIDSASFNLAANYLENYPCNFVLRGKKDLLSLVGDIAYQARSELRIRDNTVYMYYLSVKPTPVMTIDESLVFWDETSSLEFSLTDSDDIVTKYVANWSPAEVPVKDGDNVQYAVSLKHNVGTYGLHKEEKDYYTLTTLSTILKTATFWLIRKSNSWKMITLTGPLPLLLLEVEDAVTVDLDEFSSTPVLGIIKNASFDYKDNTVSLEIWTPVKCGDTTEYYWTWPANKPASAVFPLPGEDAGPAYSFEVVVPLNHILSSGDDPTTILSNGDPHPSDYGDTFPYIDCYDPATDLDEVDQVQRALAIANESYSRSLRPRIPNILAYQEALSTLPSAPSSGYVSGFPYTFSVGIGTITPETVSVNGVTKSSGSGLPASGNTSIRTHYFANIEGAQSYRTAALQEVGSLSLDDGYYTVGTTSPTSVSSVVTTVNPAYSDPGSVESTNQYYYTEIAQYKET